MVRRTLAVLAIAVLGVVLVPATSVLAGGGCHEAPTTGTGTEVDMIDACFTPTTLRVQPGDTVTFVNQDTFVHMVGGNGWGHFEDLQGGDTFAATFDEAGIYPYACIYHPGMTGAIVVGSGTGAGNGQTVTAAVDTAASPAAPIEVRAVGAETDDSHTDWLAVGAIGLAIGLAGGWVLRRPRRPGPDPS
jgi:plastocyanin